MSNTEKDPAFYSLADDFIALANKMAKQTEAGKVSAAFLYAAARYNTFIVARSAESAAAFHDYQEDAKRYFLEEYEKMLNEHMSDYETRFDKYIKADLAHSPDNNRTIN